VAQFIDVDRDLVPGRSKSRPLSVLGRCHAATRPGRVTNYPVWWGSARPVVLP
jgi:hypothetical protein